MKLVFIILVFLNISCGQKVKISEDFNGNKPADIEPPPAPPAPPPAPVYAAYCGDSIINQDWEECDGSANCNDQCQNTLFANACRDYVLAKLTLDVNGSNELQLASYSGLMRIGSEANSQPIGRWFALSLKGENVIDSAPSALINDDANLVRNDGEIEVFFAPHSDGLAHVEGRIEFFQGRLANFAPTSSNNLGADSDWAMDGIKDYTSKQDEIWALDNQLYFWLSTHSEGDRFSVKWQSDISCK